MKAVDRQYTRIVQEPQTTQLTPETS